MSGEFKVTKRIVKDLDTRKFIELRNRVTGLKHAEVRVGLPNNKSHRVKDETTGKWKRLPKKAKRVMLTLIGAVHEFGAPERGIPKRPWLRPGVKSGKADYVRLNRRNLLRILKGTMIMDSALKQLGHMAVGKVQTYIRESGHFAPLSERTIQAKGSSRPLIDTAQMMQSVTFEVGKKE